MKKYLFMILLFAFGILGWLGMHHLTDSSFDPVGRQREDLVRRWGRPLNSMTIGKYETLNFPQGRAFLVSGKVERFECKEAVDRLAGVLTFLSPKKSPAKPVAAVETNSAPSTDPGISSEDDPYIRRLLQAEMARKKRLLKKGIDLEKDEKYRNVIKGPYGELPLD